MTCTHTVILPQVIVCTEGRKNNLLQEVQCSVIHCLPGLSSLMAEWIKASGGLLAPLLLIRKVEKWSEGQQQRFIVLQYITQSPEIWDRHCAWLESWIPKRLCHSGSTLFFVIPLSPVCLQPSMPFCLSPCQSIFVYTSWTDQRLSQDNHQLHKESHGGDSRLHDGLLQHFKPYVLGFDTVCFVA